MVDESITLATGLRVRRVARRGTIGLKVEGWLGLAGHDGAALAFQTGSADDW